MPHFLSVANAPVCIGLVVGLVSVVAAEGDSPFAAIQDDPTLPRVLLIGDSISIGYTLPARALLTGKANVHRPPVNCGDTASCLRSIDEWLGNGRWDVIHFNFGIHDIKCPKRDGVNNTPLERYKENLGKIVARLQETGATLVWCSTTQSPEAVCGAPAEDFVTYNAAAKEIMEKNGVQVNDLYTFTLPRLKEIQIPVNSHFHAEGSRVLAEQVATAIRKALDRHASE